MSGPAGELACRLARDAEMVCRYYLSNGRRSGRYWQVGDVANTPGRSLFVRLSGPISGRGAAGKWTDAATGEHGDLLDLIRLNRELGSLRDTLDEARSFLRLPRSEPAARIAVPRASPEAARRLFAGSRSVLGSFAETYLRERGVTASLDLAALRFHPSCYYRNHDRAPREAWPALIAAVTDLSSAITGVQRTWLSHDGSGKAPISSPRRAMGRLLGNGVRFGRVLDVMAAGEGIETMLSLLSILPRLPMVAALSANHLAALALPSTLRRLYVARDDDTAGRNAAERLRGRAGKLGVEAHVLMPMLDDFNADLRAFGTDGLLAHLRPQLVPEDAERFIADAQ